MTSRPHRSTLFPYTTLFRSMILYNDIYDDISWDAVWESSAKITAKGWIAEVRIPYSQLRFPEKDAHTWGLDRKSTRLNSSHLVISYAVFCLKKTNLTFRNRQ